MSRTNATPATRTDARVPQQLRSRKRMESIIRTSNVLIARHGILGLKMNEIARVARVPVGSVYQYFPTKSTLIAHLFRLRLQVYHEIAERYLADVRDPVECAAGIRRALLEIYLDNREDLLMQEIWAGVQADRTIREIHLWDNEFFSRLFFEAVRRVGSLLSEKLLLRRAQIVNEMFDGTIRLAITLDSRTGEALVEECARLGAVNLGLVSES